METLQTAARLEQQVLLSDAQSTSVARLCPRGKGGDLFALLLEEKRALRITKGGLVDFWGKPGGPFAEFRAVATDCCETGEAAAVTLQGTRTGRWLALHGGDFISSDEPEPLQVQVAAAKRSTPSDGDNAAQDGGVSKRVCVAPGGPALPWQVRIQPLGNRLGRVLLATDDGNVACGAAGRFHGKGKRGQWAQWEAEESGAGTTFKNVGHSRYLAVDGSGAPCLSDTPCFFTVDSAAPTLEGILPPVDFGVLSSADKEHFKQHGYVVLRGAIPPDRVDAALRAINSNLGQPDSWVADDNVLNAGQRTLQARGSGNVFQRIVTSPLLWSALSALLTDEPDLGNALKKPQLALRFPVSPQGEMYAQDEKPPWRYHVDGMGKGRLHPFSILCGVSLSDQTKPGSGNLHVFPGSHLNRQLQQFVAAKVGDEEAGEGDDRKPDVGPSTQVLLAPGDVVLAHQLLAHRAGVNASPHVRYQLFWRIRHKRHEELKGQILDNPFVEFRV